MTGLLTLSMEVELGWGVHDTGEDDRLSDRGEAERHYLARLLEACATLDVPISFDVVGHLFLDSCPGTHESPHPSGWFAADPGTDGETDPLYYAPDVVDAIRSAPTDHELCTHTFSHALFDQTSREACRWELDRVQELHRERAGRPAESLVPPRHQRPPYDVLTDRGIRVLRPAMPRQTDSRVARYRQLLAGPQPLSTLDRRNGVVETSCTTYPSLTAATLPAGQGGHDPLFRPIPTPVRRRLHLRKLKRATRTAVERDGHLHLWCHLFDLSNEQQWRTVRPYLTWLSDYRQSNDLVISTMEGLTAHV